jgi:hypothetical protein
MASKKNLSLAEQIAATLVPAKSAAPIAVVEEPKLSLTANELQAAIAAGIASALAGLGMTPASAPVAPKKPEATPAPRPVGRPKKTPAPKLEKTAEVVDFAVEGKKAACFKAAKAAVKAAGLASTKVDGKWIDGPNGGRFSTSAKYWEAYWAGYNAEATRIGFPTNTK